MFSSLCSSFPPLLDSPTGSLFPPSFRCGSHLLCRGARAERDRRSGPSALLRSALLFLRAGRAGHGGPCDGEGAIADGQVLASAYTEPSRAAVRHFGPDCSLHRLLLPPLHLYLRAALAGPAVPTQALQLPDGVPVPVPAVVGPAHRALLLLLQKLCHSQQPGAFSLLAALLPTCLPPVLHPQSHEPLLCTGELSGLDPVSTFKGLHIVCLHLL